MTIGTVSNGLYRKQAVCVNALSLFLNAQQLTSLDLWSVKFYPYTKPGVDPIFAVVGGKHVRNPMILCVTLLTCFQILICRVPANNRNVQVIRSVVDEEVSNR